MSTRNFVPRSNGEGGIGTSLKKWLNGYFNNISADTATIPALVNTPSGNIVSTTVQTAINELDSRVGANPSFRNKIINGKFSINHRNVSGTVVLSAGAYGHDRFKAGANGCTYTFSTANNVTTVTITAGSLIQIIEGNNLESGTYVLTWVGTAQGKIAGGSLSTSGVTGVVVGGTNTSIEFSTGTLTKVQFELGYIGTPFEQRQLEIELLLCYRYCRPIYISCGQAIATNGMNTIIPLVNPMYTTPSLSTTVGFNVTLANSTYTSATPSNISMFNNSLIIQMISITGLVAGNASYMIPPTGALLISEL